MGVHSLKLETKVIGSNPIAPQNKIMKQIKKLEKYCQTMLLKYSIEDDIINIDDKYYKIITDTERKLINEESEFLVEDDYNKDVGGYIFEFGGRWYIQDQDEKEIQLNEVKYLGKAIGKLPNESFLGVRSGYELMNGMGMYSEWIKKAKFLGIKNLGICEKNTLAGALVFQNECKSNDIKSIIGMTVPVKGNEVFDMKFYAKDFQGWQNLLKFNSKINVDKEKYIELNFVRENKEGLFIIADPKSMNYDELDTSILSLIDFYQLDTVRFLNEEKDIEFIDNLEKFITSAIEPISITDAFYLEKDEWRTREKLWTIAKAFDDKTDNQYFKSKTEYATELIKMFDSNCNYWNTLFRKAVGNESILAENCNFKYDTDTRHLPKYIMTEEENKQFSSNEELFIHLIKKGFKDRNISQSSTYIERLKVEVEVLRQGDVIDYFLSLYDIVRYAKSQGMLTGIGRGSAGGSLVAYLLGIIQIDPLEFDLLFERFLNSGRMGKWEDRPLYILEDNDGNKIELSEGSIVKVLRNNEEKNIFCHDIKEGDKILKY